MLSLVIDQGKHSCIVVSPVPHCKLTPQRLDTWSSLEGSRTVSGMVLHSVMPATRTNTFPRYALFLLSIGFSCKICSGRGRLEVLNWSSLKDI